MDNNSIIEKFYNYDPVFFNPDTKKWYFWDEIHLDPMGPFDYQYQAWSELRSHCQCLNYTHPLRAAFETTVIISTKRGVKFWS